MLLSLLVLVPLLGALVLGFYPGQLSHAQLRQGAIVIALTMCSLTIGIFSQFDLKQPAFQLATSLPWLPQLGLTFSLAVDGLSLPLIGLVNVLTLVLAFNANIGLKPGQELPRPRLFYSLLFLANAGVMGAFLAQNLLLFFLFYEIELIPFYLLIVIWGSERRGYAATKFLIYTALSGIILLAAFLSVNWLTQGNSFEYSQINTRDLPRNVQLVLLGMLLVGFGIKIPLVPLHSWLPDAYVESSAPVSIMLGGILSKLGTYGLVRFAIGMFPETWASVAPIMSVIAAASVVYGAMAAIAQQDIKRMVAYSSIGHMGYIMLGSAALTSLSMVGVITQMVSHGLILGLLFYLVGIIESKVGTRDLKALNGLLNPVRGLPLIASLMILAAMASAGIPGMLGFISEFMVFQGSYPIYPAATIVCIFGTILTAVYFVILLNRTCFGRLDSQSAYYPVVTRRESLPALGLAAIIVILGIQPTWVVKWTESTSNKIVTGAYPRGADVANVFDATKVLDVTTALDVTKALSAAPIATAPMLD
ncbi:NADH-quinone oxidoreductase subunit M [filamentous cyanobacterium LEGE 11480]|uniref:NADH-quinone oxidoreductase subunit M n=1 Tax=Romeriopsis navalis LEGE 11480 TaxID=2777977 RepID=A0A928Z442_9CYAN|nr:NADH-quinone oxidoreductase subunit M [Romeriopsis navalis]MBE9030647.1 NADH-quinone oxidoreductase subunit M [Romeriopsis navalis LEGE 11480]